MTQLPRETQKNGDTNKSKGTSEHAKHKRRLNMQKNTLSPTGLYELVLVVLHMENFQCTACICSVYHIVHVQRARDHFNCSPLLFS